MKKLFPFALFIFMTASVIAQSDVSKIRCDHLRQNGFKSIIVEPSFESIVGEDTARINELKFSCMTIERKSQLIMYQKFGKWDSFVQTKDGTSLLVWKNIKLFKNKEEKYTVVAHGVQNLYTSFMVFDEHNKDLLSIDSTQKEELIKYFKKLIRNYSSKRSNFCKDYNEELKPDEPLFMDDQE